VFVRSAECLTIDATSPLDFLRVTADCCAVFIQNRRFGSHILRCTEGVPDIRMLGCEAERNLWSGATDQDRDMPVNRAGGKLAESLPNFGKIALEIPQAIGRG